MRGPLTDDEVEDLYARATSPAKHRAAAEELEAWAAEPHPQDAVHPAALLVRAGEHLSAAGDHDGAVVLFHRAVAAGQPVPPDARCYLHGALLQTGDAEAARQLADELRRERPADGDVYLFLGESYESAGDLRQAHRWLTLGAQRALSDVQDGEFSAADDATGLLMARLRVRDALGLPLDEYDALVTSALLGERVAPD
ncbi:M48 family metallopeptidase [Geodermatophilus sp. DSM 44513]|uniref:tetratricopeptide repeat protein n=1 Tax=Geodermatophilus sp. DSM 44513 TaxID=1528104 RepID=UPI00127AD267|nr:tetratricopeptide repeat protein [Geodermatophilus sp. DSM 44513]WNV74135.1 hypothetical protein RTG05_14180 [Geodermatophilus sp. DSM 44513]